MGIRSYRQEHSQVNKITPNFGDDIANDSSRGHNLEFSGICCTSRFILIILLIYSLTPSGKDQDYQSKKKS